MVVVGTVTETISRVIARECRIHGRRGERFAFGRRRVDKPVVFRAAFHFQQIAVRRVTGKPHAGITQHSNGGHLRVTEGVRGSEFSG